MLAIRRTPNTSASGNAIVMIKKLDKFCPFEECIKDDGSVEYILYDDLNVICDVNTLNKAGHKTVHDLQKVFTKLTDNTAISKHFIGRTPTPSSNVTTKTVLVSWRKNADTWSKTSFLDVEGDFSNKVMKVINHVFPKMSDVEILSACSK